MTGKRKWFPTLRMLRASTRVLERSGFLAPPVPLPKAPIQLRTRPTSFPTREINTHRPTDTNSMLFCVCFCFAVMPLTWDWPVCVFVNRIFIFIQFPLFENAQSMMHLTDY